LDRKRVGNVVTAKVGAHQAARTESPAITADISATATTRDRGCDGKQDRHSGCRAAS